MCCSLVTPLHGVTLWKTVFLIITARSSGLFSLNKEINLKLPVAWQFILGAPRKALTAGYLTRLLHSLSLGYVRAFYAFYQ